MFFVQEKKLFSECNSHFQDLDVITIDRDLPVRVVEARIGEVDSTSPYGISFNPLSNAIPIVGEHFEEFGGDRNKNTIIPPMLILPVVKLPSWGYIKFRQKRKKLLEQ